MDQAQSKAPLPVGKAKRAEDETTFQATKDSKKIALDSSDPIKFVVLGDGLSSKWEGELVEFLRENRDIFAWSPQDMPGVPRELAEHKLHIRPGSKPIKQPLRRFSEDKRRVIGEEIAKLLAAGFIMEVFYPDWLANPVLVMKKNGTWRMCIDYTCLNKACPKDPFALPRIDQVIDYMVGCQLLCFLDATAGYH